MNEKDTGACTGDDNISQHCPEMFLKKKTNFKETNKFLGADQIDKNKVTRNCTPTDTRKFTEYSEKYHLLNFVRASTGNFVS